MAGINVGGGHGGKKPVDSEIPLVPFIDLLLCCVMFLLVTAVWNQLARINANQATPSQQTPEDAPPPEDKVKLILRIHSSGYTLASTDGVELPINKKGEDFDVGELRSKLQERHKLEPNRKDIIVAPEDGISYTEIVKAMDLVVGEGYPDMALQDGASLVM